MLPLPITVAIGVTPDGSEALFGPKNQSKFGVGESACVSTVAEHTREKLVPAIAVLEAAEGLMVTGPMSTEGGMQWRYTITLGSTRFDHSSTHIC